MMQKEQQEIYLPALILGTRLKMDALYKAAALNNIFESFSWSLNIVG